MELMELECLLPDPSALALRGIYRVGDTYHFELEATAPLAACPGCGAPSARVHSRYTRRPDDLPVSGFRVRLELRARKFFCDAPFCARSIFCERLPAVLAAYARRTLRLAQVLTHLALLVSANDARRMGRVLALPGSANSFLRLAHAHLPPTATATAMGIDDFAFRRGHTYGTLVLDLVTHRPVDVLADRSLELIRDYLQTHPEIQVIARDRDARYAEAIRWAAPQAQVVLDRWHLVRNLTEAFERHVTRHHATWGRALREQFQESTALADTQVTELPPELTSRITRASASELERRRERQAWRQARFDRVHELHTAGKSKREIGRDTGLDWHTITAYLSRAAAPDHTRTARSPSRLDPYAPHLRKRWGEGCHNAAQLAREITELGYRGSRRMVTRYVQDWRAASPPEAPRAPPALPPPRSLTWLLLRQPEDLKSEEADLLSALSAAAPAAAELAALTRAGMAAIANRDQTPGMSGASRWRPPAAANSAATSRVSPTTTRR